MSRVLDLHQAWLANPDYAQEFAALDEEFGLTEALIAARSKAGMTQHELADRMHTTQSAIARLESGRALPSIRTLKRVAAATGTRLRISFERATKDTAPGRSSKV